MRVELTFTNKGKLAIANFSNEELLEIFSRYMNTLKKKYDIEVAVDHESNPNIISDNVLLVHADNVNCDAETFFKELSRDVKVPLKKRLEGNLDNVFKIKISE
ncbi:hypothetical protein [Paenibacillus assamensis]|uniref:hypothetical protein n=1 Tax=Paenibacillus assamensis TaxID=311244 RepID=UPI00041FE085|nr:hypothetical protein [Paenibacillus assamensis]